MPDYIVSIRLNVTGAESPKAAAQRANCWLFDHLAEQTALVLDAMGATVGAFPLADLDRELHEDMKKSGAASS